MRRIVVVLGVATAMLALIAGPVVAEPVAAPAEPPPNVYMAKGSASGVVGFSDCGDIYESMTLSYDYKGIVTYVVKPDGGLTAMLHHTAHGQAVSLETGKTFLFHTVDGENIQLEKVPVLSEDGDVLEPGELRTWQYTGSTFLVSPGSEANFFIKWLFRYDTNGELELEDVRISCRG
jgi:hypothetical protein